jgi:hypothetical protein
MRLGETSVIPTVLEQLVRKRHCFLVATQPCLGWERSHEMILFVGLWALCQRVTPWQRNRRGFRRFVL